MTFPEWIILISHPFANLLVFRYHGVWVHPWVTLSWHRLDGRPGWAPRWWQSSPGSPPRSLCPHTSWTKCPPGWRRITRVPCQPQVRGWRAWGFRVQLNPTVQIFKDLLEEKHCYNATPLSQCKLTPAAQRDRTPSPWTDTWTSWCLERVTWSFSLESKQ